jgi:pyruvate/2-oxoglutarate dehydrogenase complex dihydrolipoamide dehydrogenase (E3) component/uncharacterized membrane protein YdjX (TVP38/TMEM64 family)
MNDVARSGQLLQRLLLLTAIVAVVAGFFALGLHRQLTLENLRAAQGQLEAWRTRAPVRLGALYALAYVVVTGLSLPGAAIMTLAGGAIFGLLWGTVLVSFASTAGATLAFLLARTLFRDLVQRRFGGQLAPIEAGIRKDGASYLLTLRLAPVVPFFLINILMGLTAMPVLRYALVSQVGMLPGTIVYVNAGTQLAALTSLRGILSPPVLGSLLLLALFPWIVKLLLGIYQRWQIYRPWQRPRHFDRNLIVIGAGAAGLVTSYIAATVKARVTLVEASRMGGDCLNTGCVPSKALITTARLAARLRRGERYGLPSQQLSLDLPQVLERVKRKVEAVAPHDSVERYTGLGVDVRLGHARLIDPWTVAIHGADGTETRLTSRSIVLATGASPVIPPIPGIETVRVLTSETVWEELRLSSMARPSLLVLGGGPIGCELSQAMAQLGLEVTLVQRNPFLLPREDEEVSASVRQALEADGVRVLTGAEVVRLEPAPAEGASSSVMPRGVIATVESAAGRETIGADAMLCAVGRRARLEGYGLDTLGIPTARTIETNAALQTRYPNICAVGDVAGPWQFTHTASHQAWYAAVNTLFTPLRFRVDGRVIPRTTFTDPEVATVGLTERQARQANVACEVTRFELADLDRAIVESAETGFVKVLTPPGKDRILGVTIVGEHAGELLSEFVLAMKWNLGLGKIMGAIHAYPTMAEANKYAAGAWKKAHAPQRLLQLLKRYHEWRRG